MRVGGHDVFVSYSRTDSEFVRRLQEGLTERGRDVWVDWEGIAPTAEWMAEIHRAIDAANTVVVVLSPDFIVSRICTDEITHAIDNNKRIIPVVCRDIVASDAPEDIAKLNWIFARASDDESAAFDSVVAALDTDLGYVRAHTKLLVRAREWDGAGRENSRLLRGGELGEAERWFAEGKDPEPTRLQTEFILASRAAAGRTQRIRLALSLVALVVCVALLGFAIRQRSAAVTQRDRAVNATRLAVSKQLVAEALLQKDIDPELGLLLAIRAAGTAQNAGAADALRQILEVYPVRVELQGRDPSFSPDGTMIAVDGGPDHPELAPQIVDAATGVTQATYAGLGAGVGATDIQFSPDGDRVAFGASDGTVHVFDAKSGAGILVIEGISPGTDSQRWIYAVAFDPGGKRIVAGGRDGSLTIYDANSGEKIRELIAGSKAMRSVRDAAFSPDGRDVVAAIPASGLHVWDASTGREIFVEQGEGGKDFGSSKYSADGRTIVAVASATQQSDVLVLDALTGEPVRTIRIQGFANAAAYSPDDRFIAAGDTNVVRIWDAASGKLQKSLRGHTDVVTDVQFSPDGSEMLTGSFDFTARVWGLQTALLSQFRASTHHVNAAVLSPDGSMIATAQADATARLWQNDGKGTLLRTLQAGSATGNWQDRNVWTADFSPDGTELATASGEGYATIWDVRSGESLVKLETRSPVWDVDFSPTGDRVVAAQQDGSASVWDASTGKRLTVLEGDGGPVYSVAFTPDGTVITGARSGTIGWWDAATGESTRILETSNQNQILSMDVSRDGRRLVTAELNGKVAKVRDARTGRVLATLTGHSSTLWNTNFSPDGKLVATASLDGTARVWDAVTGKQLDLFTGSGQPLYSTVFDNSGVNVLTAGADGTVRLYPCGLCGSTEALVKLAESRVSRDFTAAERARYGIGG